jgi:uncharacterized protein
MMRGREIESRVEIMLDSCIAIQISKELKMVTTEMLNEITKRLVKAYDPVAIYLFGSYAWGSPTNDSDIDLLVVVNSTDKPRWERSHPGSEALWGLRVSKDLLVYTKVEFDRAVGHPSSLASKVKNEGVVLYGHA